MERTRKFNFLNLWDKDTLCGYFCADKSRYTAEQTEELFKREYRAAMDDMEINGGSAEEYREQAKAISGFARFEIGKNEDDEPCGGYVFFKTIEKDLYGKPKSRGAFEVWAIKDGTEYDW